MANKWALILTTITLQSKTKHADPNGIRPVNIQRDLAGIASLLELCFSDTLDGTARAAIKEMHRQVGDLQINSNGIATRGLLIRHLVLPNNLAGTNKIVSYLAKKISPNTYLNIMDQYHPAYQSNTLPDINRQISLEEYQQAVKWAQTAGLKRLDKRRS